MKRALCILSILGVLLFGSVSVFADPYAVPDDSNSSVQQQYE